jgi:hypothetical protein
MAEAEPQMCFSCSVRPATTSDGTVPLCEDCAARIKNPRGVEYESHTESGEPPEPVTESGEPPSGDEVPPS